jgi:hypothetical protein
MKHALLAFLCWSLTSFAFAQCVGKMINPITDVCWSCLLAFIHRAYTRQ